LTTATRPSSISRGASGRRLRSGRRPRPLELDPAVLRPIPTGFPHLDANTGGGLPAEDLVLVVGKHNVGKTLFVSQLGRNIARWASQQRSRVVCVLVCYEHSPLLLLQRLLHMESWVAGAVRKSAPRLERSVNASGSPKLRQLPALLLPLVSLTAQYNSLAGLGHRTRLQRW